MNKRRGFTRLALAFGIPYFGFWALTWQLASSALPRHLQWSIEATNRGEWRTAGIWMEHVNGDSAAVERSLLWGIIIPIAALIVGALVYWVYRGFRSTPPQ